MRPHRALLFLLFLLSTFLPATLGFGQSDERKSDPAAKAATVLDEKKDGPEATPAATPATVKPEKLGEADDPPNVSAPEAVAATDGDSQKAPVARYLTVLNPVGDLILSRVRNALIQLQQQAEQESREAILILELQPGTSSYGQIRELCRELTSASFSRVRTVAWIPQTENNRRMDGYILMAALACREVITHPEVEFGDLGLGKTLDDEEKLAVINMVEKQYNARINGALAAGMADPSRAVLRVTIETARGDVKTTETRIVTQEELRRLQDSNLAIMSTETVKEQGDVFRLSSTRARKLDVLVTQTIEDRTELADLLGFDRQYLREDLSNEKTPSARIIQLRGVIDPQLYHFVSREVKRAVASGIDIIILEIESPGGHLHESLLLANLLSEVNSRKHRTIAWIPDHALSGAAIIALGCDEILMTPAARLGDAGPIELRKDFMFHRAPEKILSDLRVNLRELAKRKNRSPALAEAMADKDLAVYQATHHETGRVRFMTEDEIKDSKGEWIQGPLVPESRNDNLLTVNGQRAYELQLAGKPVRDYTELKARLGIPASQVVPAVEQTWVDSMVAALNHPLSTFLLFLVALVCLKLEFQTMTGAFGIVAALCFGLFFWSHYLGGTATGLEILLFVFGAVLLVIEIFLIPGFGVFGITGALAILSSLVMASHTFILPSTGEELDELSWTLGSLSGSIVAMFAVAIALSSFLPNMPGFRRMVLAPPGSGSTGPRLNPELVQTVNAQGGDLSLVNQHGVAVSMLRPSGKARIASRVLDVISDSGFIEPGTSVVVASVSGNRIIVRPARVDS